VVLVVVVVLTDQLLAPLLKMVRLELLDKDLLAEMEYTAVIPGMELQLAGVAVELPLLDKMLIFLETVMLVMVVTVQMHILHGLLLLALE
jgi:hypothetical protein